MPKKLFSVSYYDTGDGYKKEDDWKRYSDAYVIAESLDSATKIAEKNAKGDQIVAGINERVEAIIYIE